MSFSQGFSNFNRRMDSSFMGSHLKRGTAESFGWQYHKGKNYGFMGKVPSGSTASVPNQGKFSKGMGKAGSFGMRGLGLAATAYFAYSGYQEGGVLGAAKGIGESIAGNVIFNMGFAALANPYVAAGAAVAAVGYAGYKTMDAGIEHAKGLRSAEFSAGDQAASSYATATARQRAVQALNNSHLNHRNALGNEAYLMHQRQG